MGISTSGNQDHHRLCIGVALYIRKATTVELRSYSMVMTYRQTEPTLSHAESRTSAGVRCDDEGNGYTIKN